MLKYNKPRCVNEVIIQADLYHACKEAGLICDLEYICYTNKKEKCILDLIVIENHQVIAIVEVKTPDSVELDEYKTEQIKRYKQFGIPVLVLWSVRDISKVVKKLVRIQQNYLKSLEENQAIFNENEKQSKNKWEEKINIAIDEFNEVFPNYEFTNEYSMETIARAVKVLGLDLVLKIINNFFDKKVEDFFFQLNISVDYRLQRMKGCSKKHDKVQTVTSEAVKLAIIDSKIN